MSYFFELVSNSADSLIRVLSGLSMAIVYGICLGLLRSSLPMKVKSNLVFNFILESPKYPPPIAWIPFVILLMGIGEWSAITIVFIGAFPPIFTSCYEGIERLPKNLFDISKSFELSKTERLIRIRLMWALPTLFTGVRIGAGMGWMSVIAAEMISGQSGLGYSIQLNRLNLQFEYMIYDMISIGSIGYVIAKFLAWLEKKIIAWEDSELKC
ncbi:MAG: ABC transporter permease subunit [Bdellovibrionales bacterium]|nr:ABC transporter permease subunit [Bdellovibrionales bacterium]